MVDIIKFIGFLGIAIGAMALLGSIYLFMLQATMISLTRDVIGNALYECNCPNNATNYVYDFINDNIANIWSKELLATPILSIILIAISITIILSRKR